MKVKKIELPRVDLDDCELFSSCCGRSGVDRDLLICPSCHDHCGLVYVDCNENEWETWDDGKTWEAI